jgi:hypothetical protein
VGFTTKTGEFRISDCELIRDGEDRRRRSGERRTVNGERQCKTGVLARYPLKADLVRDTDSGIAGWEIPGIPSDQQAVPELC